MTQGKKIVMFSVLGVIGAYVLFSLISIANFNQGIKEIPNQDVNGLGELMVRLVVGSLASAWAPIIYFRFGVVFLVLVLVEGIILLVVFRKKNENPEETKPAPIKIKWDIVIYAFLVVAGIAYIIYCEFSPDEFLNGILFIVLVSVLELFTDLVFLIWKDKSSIARQITLLTTLFSIINFVFFVALVFFMVMD